MIEIYLKKADEGRWELKAAVLPKGGIGGLAQEASLAEISAPRFDEAYAAVAHQSLAELSFAPVPDRWPVPEPRFRIVNEGSHAHPEAFGNYRVQRGDQILGCIENFPRGQRGELIKEALKIAARCGALFD